MTTRLLLSCYNEIYGMSELPHNIISRLKEVLPGLSEEKASQLHACLWDIGVRSPSDVTYVKESELSSVLNPIQCRKLLHLWNSVEDSVQLSVPEISASEPQSVHVDSSTAPKSLSPDWPSAFVIPFQRANADFLQDLQEKRRPKKKLLLEFVRTVCADIQTICSKPGRAALATIAKKIVDAYPESLSDTLGGSIVGSGYDSLRAKLENRLDNMNRGSSAPPRVTTPSEKKRPASDSYGCIEWSCSIPAGETLESQEEKRLELEEMFSGESVSLNDAAALMDQTYYLQRQHINEGISVSDVQDKWPWLLTITCLLNHFKRLTGVDAKANITEAMSVKGKVILQYFATVNKEDIQKVLDAVGESFRQTGTRYGDPVGVLQGTLATFREESTFFIVELKPDMVIQEAALPPTPLIVCVGSPYRCRNFLIAADQQVVMSGISEFTDALSCLMAIYFVFNIAYPPQVQATLDFLQRCFLQINPELGTRLKKKRHGPGAVIQKVLSFVEDIKRYEANSWVFG
ncbi:uncharacterized protein LOC135366447 isoform X4 [Ornithodoros turicata]|uniref:uncharacterized protein LOC135366447 isoform X4 n=1 Tax=Ornithodoros turicata TaxID=34597 RepID=UPI003139DAA3